MGWRLRQYASHAKRLERLKDSRLMRRRRNRGGVIGKVIILYRNYVPVDNNLGPLLYFCGF
jgi:hypothetical protein